MTDGGAAEVAAAFTDAVSAGDAEGARATADPARWDAGQDRVADLVGQAVRKGLALDRVGHVRLSGDRGAQRAVLSKPGGQRPLGDLWLLLERAGAGWQVVGATKVRGQVGLFLGGHVAAEGGPTDLARSKLAEQAVAAWIAEGGPALPDGVEVITSAAVPGVGRAAVGLGPPGGDVSTWAIVDLTDGEARLRETRPRLRFERLLADVDVPWPDRDPAQG